MFDVSTPTRQKSWQTRRERVSVLAALAIQKETVSRRLAELRKQHGDPATGKPLPQEKAAARVGVTVRQWQRWESGESTPYPRNLGTIAERFGFAVSDFYDETHNGAATPDGSQLDRIESKLDRLLRYWEDTNAPTLGHDTAQPHADVPPGPPEGLQREIQARKPKQHTSDRSGRRAPSPRRKSA